MNQERQKAITEGLRRLRLNYRSQWDQDMTDNFAFVLGKLFDRVGLIRLKSTIDACCEREEFLKESNLLRHVPDSQIGSNRQRCVLCCDMEGFSQAEPDTYGNLCLMRCTHSGQSTFRPTTREDEARDIQRRMDQGEIFYTRNDVIAGSIFGDIMKKTRLT